MPGHLEADQSEHDEDVDDGETGGGGGGEDDDDDDDDDDEIGEEEFVVEKIVGHEVLPNVSSAYLSPLFPCCN